MAQKVFKVYTKPSEIITFNYKQNGLISARFRARDLPCEVFIQNVYLSDCSKKICFQICRVDG